MNLAWLFDVFYSIQGLAPRTSMGHDQD